MKRLSLFDQPQIRFPIKARICVRRSAEAGAAAASTSKSGFGGSLLTIIAFCPRGKGLADDETTVTIWPAPEYLSKDILPRLQRLFIGNQEMGNVGLLPR